MVAEPHLKVNGTCKPPSTNFWLWSLPLFPSAAGQRCSEGDYARLLSTSVTVWLGITSVTFLARRVWVYPSSLVLQAYQRWAPSQVMALVSG